jgi:acylphosphatase
MTRQKLEAMISGVVQGVGFRYYVYRTACQLGLVGWARNLPDGRVQVVAEGDRGTLEIFIKELKVGPRFASITDIALRWGEPEGKYTSFGIQ